MKELCVAYKLYHLSIYQQMKAPSEPKPSIRVVIHYVILMIIITGQDMIPEHQFET